jgi:hypothetical protein
VETDAQTLVWLLNQPPNDLQNAMMTRWLAYIRLFDFEVKHVRGERNWGPNVLSRQGKGSDDSDSDSESKTDAYFKSKLCNVTADPLERATTVRVWMHEGEYTGVDLVIGRYLEPLKRPEHLTDPEFQQLRRKAF